MLTKVQAGGNMSANKLSREQPCRRVKLTEGRGRQSF